MMACLGVYMLFVLPYCTADRHDCLYKHLLLHTCYALARCLILLLLLLLLPPPQALCGPWWVRWC
jgi:hypothetical protein